MNMTDLKESEADITNMTPWYSMFSAFFAGSDYLIGKEDEVSGEAEEDHFLLLMKSIRGERYQQKDINCPSL